MNDNPANRANSIHRLSFFTLAGKTEANCEGDQVKGRWLDPHSELRSRKGGELAESFANWPNDLAGVLRFTCKYGPLEIAPSTQADGSSSEFRFSVEQWRKRQESFRQIWEECGQIPVRQFRQTIYRVELPEQVIRRRTGMEYRTANLSRLLDFDLGNVPVERLRKCARPDCHHPHFVARHLKQNYCSDVCAAWGQSQWKRKWWTEHGDAWRAKRRKKLKHGKK